VWSVLDPDDDPRDGSGDVALAVYVWTWVGEAVANVLFWRRPVVAAAGAAAMGLLAVPALRARLAAR
jgi:putative membrane protein